MTTISSSTTSTTAYKVTADTTGTLVLQTGATPTTAMTIDTSQNVGIGVSSPSVKLQVSGTTISSNFYNGTGTTSAGTWGADSGGTGASIVMYGSAAAAPGAMVLNAGGSEALRINNSGNVLVGTSTAYAPFASIGSIAPAATPSSSWGIDFASSVVPPNTAILAAAATYDLANGSGIVVIHNNGNGLAGIFLTYAGNVLKLGGDASIVAGTGGASQIGLVYNSGVGKYRINNGYATSQTLFITTIRTRTSS